MKSVLITGADGGLGRVICKELKKYGYKVVRHTHQLFVKPIKKN